VTGLSVVWFKRDLRITDHAPLVQAAARGRVIALYIYEPELLRSAEFDSSHLEFINACLLEVQQRLETIGGRLVTRIGEATRVLEDLRCETGFDGLYSHMETGNAITFERDKRVQKWCKAQSVPWLEFAQFGVMRGSAPRPAWALQWERLMRAPVLPAPKKLETVPMQTVPVRSVGLLSPTDLGLEPNQKTIQPGGSNHAWALLHSFLESRGRTYQRDMSSPVAGWEACSRLSPHIAFGSVSLREVFQTAARAFQTQPDPVFKSSVGSFLKRLRWQAHFIQKLEDEPALEFHPQNRAFEHLRLGSNPALLNAFRTGRTGFPMVDACVRCLLATGWINFRMRAMLVSFATNQLWLDWRDVGVFLGRHFLDFEPGIHWAQVHMQSALTGTNTVRMYSAIKQAREQDPSGVFIRRWIPELQSVPLIYLHQPETLPPLARAMFDCDYPAPVVLESEAMRTAKDKVFAVRKSEAARLGARTVLERHSRLARV
jgi:deoxyribodipyrimidine photo-lyase